MRQRFHVVVYVAPEAAEHRNAAAIALVGPSSDGGGLAHVIADLDGQPGSSARRARCEGE